MVFKRRAETSGDSDPSQINPRETSDYRTWDGREYVPLESTRKSATWATVIFGAIVAGTVVITPIIDKEQFRADSAPIPEVNFNPSKLNSEQQKLVDEVLRLNGLFKPDSLDSQP